MLGQFLSLPLDVLLLLVFGLLFALLFLLNNPLRTLGRAQKVSFWELFLAFLVTVLLILTLVYTAAAVPDDAPPSPVRLIVLGTAGIIFVVSFLLMLAEARREQRLRGSRGILGIWVALMVVLAAFIVPTLEMRMQYVAPTPQLIAQSATLVAGATASAGALRDPAAPAEPDGSSGGGLLGMLNAAIQGQSGARAEEPTITFTPSMTPTPSRTPQPTIPPTPTRERFVFHTRTPVPTATLGSPCLAETLYNLRVRALPNAESETLATIPYNTMVSAFARNADSTWLFVEYEGQAGWIDVQYTRASSSCAELPVREE